MPASSKLNPDAVAFGAILGRLRAERHWTYQDLARASGMHPTYLSILQNGGNVPSISTVIRLAEAFEVDPRAIFAQIVEQRQANAAQE